MLSSLNFQSVCIACLLCSHFLPFLMAKDNSRTKSRAAKRLEPYNKSPTNRSSGRSGDDRTSDCSSRGGLTRSSHARSSPLHASSEPPDWVKELLKQQQANATELKRLQNKMASSKSQSAQKPHAADPEFSFAGNKKHYQLNKEVLEKIDEALATDDAEDRTKKLTECKDLFVERNKHILLAEKYSWDTVACYTVNPFASDSDDEKNIQKAIKESKQLREEKKRVASSKVLKAKGVFPRASERRVILECSNASYPTPLVAGKQSQPREGQSACFRCFKPGHFARECHAANVQNGAGAVGQSTGNYQQTSQ